MAAMQGGIIVLARHDSRRLPFKTHRRIGNWPMLELLLRRLSHPSTSPLKERRRAIPVALVTTGRAEDRGLRILAQRAKCQHVSRYMGSVNDVVGRIVDALDLLAWDYFVRISADSPLLNDAIVNAYVSSWKKANEVAAVDVWTNVWPQRAMAPGFSVEIIRSDALRRLHGEPLTLAEREHISAGFYARTNRYTVKEAALTEELFDLHNALKRPCYLQHAPHLQFDGRVVSGRVVPRANYCVDTLHDWHRIRRLFETPNNPILSTAAALVRTSNRDRDCSSRSLSPERAYIT